VGARFFAPDQTSSEAHPASYTLGNGSFPGVKRLGRGVHHPPPSSAEVKGRVGLYLYSPSGPSSPVPRVNFTFSFTFVGGKGANIQSQMSVFVYESSPLTLRWRMASDINFKTSCREKVHKTVP